MVVIYSFKILRMLEILLQQYHVVVIAIIKTIQFVWWKGLKRIIQSFSATIHHFLRNCFLSTTTIVLQCKETLKWNFNYTSNFIKHLFFIVFAWYNKQGGCMPIIFFIKFHVFFWTTKHHIFQLFFKIFVLNICLSKL